jgi:hypothetical protein
MNPGRRASRETTEFGRCPKRDDPSCSGCTTQNFINKDTTREPCKSWKRLVAARRGTARLAKVARRKKNLIRKNRTRDNMVRRTSKRRTFGRKRQPTQKDKNGLRSRRLTHRLRNWREYNKTFMKTYEKMTGVGSRETNCRISCHIAKEQELDTVEGSTPSKTEIGTGSRGGVGKVEAPGSPWSERVTAEE